MGFLRARGFREPAVFVVMLAWTYYLIFSYVMLTEAVNPMVQQLERLAYETEPAPRVPGNLDFPARAQETREDYWTTDVFYQNTTPATGNIYQNYTLAIDRLFDDYL